MISKKVIDEKTVKKIEKDYFNGKTYNQLEKKYNITKSQLEVLIRNNKWKRPSNKFGNKNAKGNKGNKNAKPPKKNKNAVVTGAYENIYDTLLDDEEKLIMQKYEITDEEAELIKQIKTLTLREYRMLKRIKDLKDKNSEMVINKIEKRKLQTQRIRRDDEEETTSEAENTVSAIQRIEVALTGVQEAKRRCIEALDKIKTNKSKLELEILKLELEQAKEEPGEPEHGNPNLLIEALNSKAKEVWKDED